NAAPRTVAATPANSASTRPRFCHFLSMTDLPFSRRAPGDHQRLSGSGSGEVRWLSALSTVNSPDLGRRRPRRVGYEPGGALKKMAERPGSGRSTEEGRACIV